MPPSTTLYVGMEVPKASMAVADVAQAHGADVVCLGSIGTRPCDIDQMIRKMHSKATHLVLVYDAGPCGNWLYCYLTKKGQENLRQIRPASTEIAWLPVPSRLTPYLPHYMITCDQVLHGLQDRDGRHPPALQHAASRYPAACQMSTVQDRPCSSLTIARSPLMISTMHAWLQDHGYTDGG
jgi:hypothetical protein